MEDLCQAVHVASVGQTKMLPVLRRLRRLFVFLTRQTQQHARTHTFRLIWCPINAIFSAHQQCSMRNFFNNVLFSCVCVYVCVGACCRRARGTVIEVGPEKTPLRVPWGPQVIDCPLNVTHIQARYIKVGKCIQVTQILHQNLYP